jgi:hypothetical protein
MGNSYYYLRLKDEFSAPDQGEQGKADPIISPQVVLKQGMTLVFNPSAFKHGVTEKDMETAMSTALLDDIDGSLTFIPSTKTPF